MQGSGEILTFVEALENTGCPDNEKLKAAANFIEDAKKNPGFCQIMMQIASNAEYAHERVFDVNLAAAIQLKNMADMHWKYMTQADAERIGDDSDEENAGPSIMIPQEDKEFVKAHIIQALSHAPSYGVLSQLEEIIYVIARYEMPNKWPNAMGEIEDLLNQDDEAKVFGGLIALKEIVHKFEYEFSEHRLPLQEIVNKLFPRIEEIFTNLIEINTDDAIKAKNIILQTFYLANQ
jgi:hypothetical protein